MARVGRRVQVTETVISRQYQNGNYFDFRLCVAAAGTKKPRLAGLGGLRVSGAEQARVFEADPFEHALLGALQVHVELDK